MIRSGADETVSAEGSLFRAFPFVMLVAAIMLLVTGRTKNPLSARICGRRPWGRGAYVIIWMFNGKRSHSLIGVLSTTCAFTSPGSSDRRGQS